MSNSNQHKQHLAESIDPQPEETPINGMRGEASATSDAATGNQRETTLAGRTVTIQEESGTAFADTDAHSKTTGSNDVAE